MAPRKPKLQHLSRREGQIMDIVYRRGRVTVQEVLDDLPDPPSYSAVRALVRVLEDKGLLAHTQDGPRYVYEPTVTHARAAHSALAHLVKTFFRGSTTEAVASLLELEGDELSRDDLDALSEMIERARGGEG
ncbi:BlaI/MecI/CopY family transcriptional regulator [Enhygromyxa salina]|uniref:Penicillinase repressor n=1 Tax=Enhygromyxa salina TaxID=215803 RepID=A0A2S9YS55_9BACT|nr:BlaI/MecI/CopY family transcriptional regulator [Enhygromyxa salina]PRQ07900.1 Penicillinase repressor [Enhygromyxa salina]